LYSCIVFSAKTFWHVIPMAAVVIAYSVAST